MLRLITIPAAASLLASCAGGYDAATPTVQVIAAETATLVQDGASIAGAWDVARFEGYEPKRLSGTVRAAFADFRPDGVSLRIECNYSGRAGTVREGRFIVSPNDGMQTAMGCGAEREARDERFFSFFTRSPTIERLGPDRLRLRAGETELVLERPTLRRLRFVPTPGETQGTWRMLEITRYIPAGGYTGSGLSEVPGRIVISGDRIGYSRCPQYDAAYRWEEGGRLRKTGGNAPAQGFRDCPELGGPAPGYELPAPADVLALLHANPLVERTPEGALLISTDRIGLLITKAPCEGREQSAKGRTVKLIDCASPL
jgi:hypothetical protein